MRRIVTIVAIFIVAALLAGCGSTKSASQASSSSSYLGTQSPGDAWSWTFSKDTGGTTIFSATNNTSGKQYSGGVATLSNKFLQLTVTSSNDSGAVGSVVPAVEFPNTAVVVKAAGSNDSPVIAAAQGNCPTQGSSYNWIQMPNQGWDPNADPAFGTATTSGSGADFSFAIDFYLLGAGTPFNAVSDTGFTCSKGTISSSNPAMPLFAATPSGVLIADEGTAGGVIGMLQPTAPIGSAGILQQGREFRGFLFMTHPPIDPGTGLPVDKTQALWSRTKGDGLITAGEYTDFAHNVEDTCPGGESCATLSLDSEVAPGEFAGTLTDSHAGAHPFTLMINQINGKYMVYGFSYNDAPQNPLLFLAMEQ